MSDTESRNPFTSRGFIFGAIIFGVLVLAAILLAITSLGGGGGQSAPATSATPAVTASPETDTAAASVCNLPGYDESGTLSTAPVTDWTIVGTMAAPSSDTAGPGVIGEDGLRSCYAHTVEGSLFSVANLWAMGTDGRLADAVLERQTAPGAGRDAAIAADIPQSNTGGSVQIVGFRVSSYTADEATIDIAFRSNTNQLLSFPAPVTWVDGDWKSVLTADGQPPFRPTALTSLGGYIPWAGTE
ncbi:MULTISPECIES: hypothetical protein [unclassified Rathayibacter]|uniref:hypothetical protein n=1 Tax=unclassified Rathayibacter TaxID=2609250 RepID=UPI000CE84573|nr:MULTISPECIES: hypothetical protein [unclassified Rathayibacter]PPF14667.1 hypothetical protein C5B92_14610 [Rathayibacter sp. AY1A4]PPF52921.1 hypothetical protein C5C55_14765 [Rathayibacter sp. AY1C2]PPG55678.1 hypothetical protein C5C57_16860 [Rathayibacter sp. AY1C5]PPG57136.1 hypothetical protein C5C69_14930 [Rathayibacter sp. AY1C7]PPH34742.1 hypothetical protein C5C53_14920 [Rathayibacter sp. AY1E3]